MAAVSLMTMMTMHSTAVLQTGPASHSIINEGAAGRSFLATRFTVPSRRLYSLRHRVNCMAESESEPKETSTATNTPPPPSSPISAATTKTTPPPPPPLSQKKVSTKFGDVFAFSGPAPETINGRLAMLGFVSALGVEFVSGQDLQSQLSSGGVSWFVLSAALLSFASLIPMFKGVSTESKSQAVMSSRAEMWNGRAAMLGLMALAITEYLKGGPLV